MWQVFVYNYNIVSMIDQLLEQYKEQFEKVLDNLKSELQSIRTGRANPAVLENIIVNVYGSNMPLKQLASISAPEARLLQVQVWDNEAVKAVEDAIRAEAHLGFNPVVAGASLRINIPELTTQRRQELAKTVAKIGEKAKIVCRNLRRELMDCLKGSEKDGEISEDEKHLFSTKVDKFSDSYISAIMSVVDKKSKDLMEM